MSVSWRHRLTVFCASFLLLLLGAGNALAEPVRNAVNAIDADILFAAARRPGFGDPAHFRIDDCTAQRNLDDEAAQARAIGTHFPPPRHPAGYHSSSEWCQCRDTANELDIGSRPFAGLTFLTGMWTVRPRWRCWQPDATDCRPAGVDGHPSGRDQRHHQSPRAVAGRYTARSSARASPCPDGNIILPRVFWAWI